MAGERLQQRTRDTRNALMRAAERLIAEKGIENVTARAITGLAGQKNESALQYHFGNFEGLIQAIAEQRNGQIEERRGRLLEAMQARGREPGLRDICLLMICPAFELSRDDPGFMLYVKGFARQLALSDFPPTRHMDKQRNVATLETRRLLFEVLASMSIDEAVITDRFDYAIRFVSLAMSHHARTKQAFHGASAEIFLDRLADMIAGLFAAPVSSDPARCSDF